MIAQSTLLLDPWLEVSTAPSTPTPYEVLPVAESPLLIATVMPIATPTRAVLIANSGHELHRRARKSVSKKSKRPRLDRLSRNQDILYLIFQWIKQDHDGNEPSSSSFSSYTSYSTTNYGFTTIHRPNNPVTCSSLQAMADSRFHDLTQDAFSKICRVNRAFARVALPFLWEKPKIRTSHQLDRFAYTLEHHGWQYFDYIKELVVREGTLPDPCSKNLWWGMARCRAILLKVATECKNLRYLDCNWAGSPFDYKMIPALAGAPLTTLKSLKLDSMQTLLTVPFLNEKDFMKLISFCPSLESLELGERYDITNSAVVHVLMTCSNLTRLVIPSTCIEGWVDAVDMGFGETLRSFKVHPPAILSALTAAASTVQPISIDPYSFPPFCLSNLEAIDLGIGSGDFVKALITRPQLPALRSLRIVYPSNSTLQRLSRRLASQLTMFEARLSDHTDPNAYQRFSSKMTGVESLDCSPGPVLGFLGRNITTLSANSSLKLIDSIADLCPNLEDLTLWGGSISKNNPCPRIRSDLQSGMIYIIEICPIKRLRLVNAYLALGPRFWQACGEFGTKLKILDIELFDCKGMSSWGLFEELRHCEGLQWLRLTELRGVRQETMISCLKDLQRLRSLSLGIPDTEAGNFSMTMDEIANFLCSFPDLSDVNLVVPKPCPGSTTTTPRSSIDLGPGKHRFGLPYARADPTMVFKNALNQNIYGRVEWSVPSIAYY